MSRHAVSRRARTHAQAQGLQPRRASRLMALAVTLLVLTLTASVGSHSATADDSAPAFTQQTTISRINVDNGVEHTVDTRTVKVTVDTTQGLRDRQAVNVSWSGAHPTGGLVGDRNSALAAQQEYPVVIMQCRGVDATTAPVNQRLSPSTCWTQTIGERYQSNTTFNFPAFRGDRYATVADRALAVGQPAPLPATCGSAASGAQHWVPFAAADGTVYYGGPQGCAGIAPEAVDQGNALQPGNTTYGASDNAGNGTARFIIKNSDSNASLGCSQTVPCSLVIIPIMGISCDSDPTAPEFASVRPPAGVVPQARQLCELTGNYAPGEMSNMSPNAEALAVSGELWWSASNWRNRITIPLTFSASANVCNIVSTSSPAYMYGSQAMAQATSQWSPAFCLNKNLFKIQQVQTSEPQAKNLLDTGTISAAIQAGPPATPFTRAVVQSPIGVTGFAIVFSVDDDSGHEVSTLKLNARLLAKLLTGSYPSNTTVRATYPGLSQNPINIASDPEFRALNPHMPQFLIHNEPAATLFAMSSDSDVMWALTSYITADPEARTWLDGTPDPWGMYVNPNYQGMSLPVSTWPQRDRFIAAALSAGNLCLGNSPVPWLPQVAGAVSSPTTVTLNMQFDIANSQILCQNEGQTQIQKLVAVGREDPGTRFLLGLVSLGDAERYGLHEALLQSRAAAADVVNKSFTSDVGRVFVAPSAGSLKAAVPGLVWNSDAGTWITDYMALNSNAVTGIQPYPGILLMSLDVATAGLTPTDAVRYATIMRFAAGAGQTPGLGNGQLPEGFLPMTSANGLAAMVAYANKSADLVQAQANVAVTTTAQAAPVAQPVVAPSVAATPAPSVASTAPELATRPAGHTISAGAGAGGWVLPALALLSLVAAGSSAISGWAGKR